MSSVIRYLSHICRRGHITATASPVDVDILALGEVVVGALGLDAEGVSAEVVALRLEQVGREALSAVTIVEAEGSAERRRRNTPEGHLADNISPAVLGVVDGLVEEPVEQEVLELGVVAVGVGNVLEENRADNAATTPHESNGWLVQFPTILLGSLSTKVSNSRSTNAG